MRTREFPASDVAERTDPPLCAPEGAEAQVQVAEAQTTGAEAQVQVAEAQVQGAEGSEDEPLREDLTEQDPLTILLARELGQGPAAAFRGWRRAYEQWDLARRPEESLRERKKRLTRQRISDVATSLFLLHGFDNVRVADVAELVGVSEKTAFNYFPTKESMVFDLADEEIDRLARALRERRLEESPTRVMVGALREDIERFAQAPTEAREFVLRFGRMVAETPSLRAAWRDLQERLVQVATQVLAEGAEVDPRDPEPLAAARALVGLRDVLHQAYARHIGEDLSGQDLYETVLADLERAARMLDTGLWSFNLLTQGMRTHRQLREAARAAEEARAQVLEAVKQARSAWKELRRGDREDLRQAAQGVAEAHREAARASREAARAGREAARAGREALREARGQVVPEEARRRARRSAG